jgi:dipeptidyl aminopeptidase/acylaminoacyl peptidase
VIDWGGATDLESLGGEKPEETPGTGKDAKADNGFVPPPSSDVGDFLGCEPARCAPMLARMASPLAYISATSPAFLIQHGAADTKVPPAQSQKLYDALRKEGVPVELLVYPDLGSGFAKGGAPDAASLTALQEKISGFLTQTFPPAPIGPRLAQPRGSVY